MGLVNPGHSRAGSGSDMMTPLFFGVSVERQRMWCGGKAKPFAEHGQLPYTKTLIGAGPRGETVIFEVNMKDPALAGWLMETFLARLYPITRRTTP